MDDLFVQTLAEKSKGLQIALAMQQPGPGTFILRPIRTFIEVGSFTGLVDIDTRVDLTLQVLDLNGALVDEIATIAFVPATLYNPSSGGRLRSSAKRLAVNIANYLHARTGV